MSDGAKRHFYERADVVATYEDWRFGGNGGAYVNECELTAVLELLRGVSHDAALLDLPCGTGRLSSRLLAAGYRNVTCADYSEEMIKLASTRLPLVQFHREDALNTSFPSASFDAIVCLRFSFHTPDLAALLIEFGRILRPGGSLIFDALRWSPRTLFPGLDRRLGGQMWTWSDSQVERIASASGFEHEAMTPLFILPSFTYRHIPGPLVRMLARFEKRLPRSAHSKTFWRLRRRDGQ